MQTTIEISIYPLREEYEPAILDFIAFLNENKDVVVRVNETSTHLFGDYNTVFDLLKEGIRNAFEKYGKAVFVMKVLNGNLQH
ncbi:MAG: hypothetical protein NWR30_04885 [Salibacteraceae bacterium]|jgi:uncharacterized protein YqgV (UPF0045/DUF77 family)|nr:hypothetical protein [Salibacteraceae bacterium]MDP4843376.1 hypothetical protein [Salibacteraceae bacterium]MDP4934024.1 hypothetical protein [Salibacteraceae bacterium]